MFYATNPVEVPCACECGCLGKEECDCGDPDCPKCHCVANDCGCLYSDIGVGDFAEWEATALEDVGE